MTTDDRSPAYGVAALDWGSFIAGLAAMGGLWFFAGTAFGRHVARTEGGRASRRAQRAYASRRG